MELQFEVAGSQVDGARDYQEDAFLVTYLGEGAEANAVSLVIVADGMGGHAAGNVASNLATSTFNKTFQSLHPTEDVPAALRQALFAANDAIRSAVQETPALQGMGCTMVAAYVAKGRLWWVSVGDSHLYLLRDRALAKKNADHSYGGYVKRMRDMGAEVEADPNLSPHMLMSAMIGDEIADVDLSETPLQLLPGDRILVATDGLDTLGQGSILQASAYAAGARDCVSMLLKAVEDAAQPRQDNATVVCIDVRARETRAAPPPAQPAPERRAPAERAPPRDGIPELQPLDEALQPAPFPRRAWTAGEAEATPRRRWPVFAALAVVVVTAGGIAAYLYLPGGASPTTHPAPAAPAPADRPAPASTPAAAEPPAVATVPTSTTPPAAAPFRDALRSGGWGPAMVQVAGGSFQMGSPPINVNPDERPQRTVQVSPFAMGVYEVTFAEYGRFARATNRAVPSAGDLDPEDHPVVGVSWDAAAAYAQWLSRETGKRYRLPSEAEWEYAARANTRTLFWWGNDVGKGNAHCFDCKSGLHPRQPARVGFFEANPFGLHDTAGNVAEWVHDCYHADYNDAPATAVVWEGGDCSRRAVRGGSFSSPSSALRTTKRDRLVSSQGYDNVGIRVVRDP
jgi:formylglycine-generating enzyme required for sulfatase activity/serine/threonine protein phosphatase PrpC